MEHRVERPVVVVPIRADVTGVELELLARVDVVLDDAPVRAIDRLVAALRPPGLPVVGELQRSLLLRDILLSRPPGSPLGRLAGHPGGLDALSALLDEFGDGGLPTDQVRNALFRWAGAGGGALADDLLAVYQAYVECLAGWGRVDRHQALTSAVEGCASWGRPVAFHGFMSFTPAQRALVEALARRLPVVVTLASDPGRDIRGGPSEEVGKLRPLAVSETALRRQELAYASPAVAHLEESFLKVGAEPWSGPNAEERATAAGPALEGVRFLLAAGRRNELELAAGEIVSLLRAGVSPDDIGVLVRRVEPWRSAISDVFGRYGVPYRLDGAVEFGATGLGFALLSALRGVARHDLESLLGFLRSPYHPAAVAEVDVAEVTVRGGLRGLGPADALELQLPDALEAARAALRWCGGEVEGVDAGGMLSLAQGMLTTSAGAASPGSPAFEQDARALRALARALLEIGDLASAPALDDPPVGGLAHRSFETALSVLARLSVTLGRGDEAGVVRVTTVKRARARRFQVVFVLGLVDSDFPGSERAPGLLGARDRAVFVGAGGVPVLPPENRSDDASLFALALSRPWQLLYLSGRDAEDDGAEALPSPFWLEATRLLPGLPIGPRRGLEDVVHAPASAPTEREFLRSCAALGLTPSDPERAGILERLVSWECRPSRLTHPTVLSALSAREVFSATELERYARCPFGWFAERAVGLRTMEEDLGPLQIGSVLHEVLRTVYEELGEAGVPRLTSAMLSEASAGAWRALTAAIDGMRGMWPDAELELMRARVGELIRVFLAFDAGSGSELTVGDLEATLPAAGVDLGGFRLSGRIDRIDVDPATGALVVIDYKSGSDVHGPDFAKHGFLQVPLYALAVGRDRPGVEVAGGVYVGLKGCVRQGAVLKEVAERAGRWVPSSARVDADTLDAEFSRALALARRAADGIRGGDIRAEPLEECPSYCTLSPLCRTPRKAATW